MVTRRQKHSVGRIAIGAPDVNAFDDTSFAASTQISNGQAGMVLVILPGTDPDIAAQWHPTKNGDVTPDQVTASSGTKAWRICHKGPDHEWQATIGNRTTGHGCSTCAGEERLGHQLVGGTSTPLSPPSGT